MQHTAKVCSVENGLLKVSFERNEACANCQIKSACGMHNSDIQLIEVADEEASSYKIGQIVELEIKEKDAAKALLMAYVLPLFLMLITLIFCWKITSDELKSAIYSLAILFPYYLLLYFLGKRTYQNIDISIKKDFY